MPEFTSAQITTLAQRLDLRLSEDELDWLTRCFNGYRGQLARLHDLDLDEDVVEAFEDPPGLTP